MKEQPLARVFRSLFSHLNCESGFMGLKAHVPSGVRSEKPLDLEGLVERWMLVNVHLDPALIPVFERERPARLFSLDVIVDVREKLANQLAARVFRLGTFVCRRRDDDDGKIPGGAYLVNGLV